jgi:O-antigen/teichoic acid export membrane protein
MAIVALVGSLAGLGINGIVVRNIVRDPSSARATLATGFVLQLIGGCCSIVVIILIASWLHPIGSDLFLLLSVLGLTLVFKCSEVAKYWFEATLQSRYAVWVENGGLLAGAAARVVFICLGAGLLAFAWVTLLESAIVALGLLMVMRILGTGFSLRVARRVDAARMIREAWPLLLAGLTVTLYMRLDMLMLDRMSGTTEVGIYAAATRISEVLYLVPVAIVSSVSPSIIRSHQKSAVLYAARMQNLYFALVWMAVIATFPLALMSSNLVALIYGAEYAAAGPVLAIHLWASVAVFVGVASSQHLIVGELQVLSFWRTLIGLACNVVLNLVLIPSMASKGAALATVISYFVATYSLILFKATRQHAVQMLIAPFAIPQYLRRKS